MRPNLLELTSDRPHEPAIRRTIFDVTTFNRIEDEKCKLYSR